MPTTVTATNGNTYHLWQLGNLTAPEPSDTHEFSTLDNEMSEGYRSTSLFGLNTGIRSWTLPMPTLADSSVIAAAVTDPYAATVSRVDYVRNLYKYNRTTGIPFAYQDPNSGQYYLVDIVDPELSMTKVGKGIDIYDSTITFRQRRLNGVTILNPAAFSSSTATMTHYYEANDTDFGGGGWSNQVSGASSGTLTGDVIEAAAAVNGHDAVRFNNSASTGYFSFGSGTSVYDLFLVMKMREASFSNNGGIVTGGAGGPSILIGSSGTTKFANPALTASLYTYRKNGTEYAQSNLQAPMNAWGVVHVRYQTGWSLTSGNLVMGRNGVTSADYAKADIAEMIIFSGSNVATLQAREITEYLAVKYAITLD